MRAFVIASVTLATLFAAHAHAACSAQSAERLHVVELYTSEGCSSCPPAEKWMSSLAKKPGYVGLEFHVDYWDNGGWRDPFDSKAYTQRQEALSKRANKGQYYTPQVWVDGDLWHNWPRPDDQPNGYGGTQSDMQLDATVDQSINAHVTTTLADPKQRIYVALTENGLSESVRAGENKGRTLAHDQVVRAFAGPFDKGEVSTTLKVPDKVDLSKSNLVAFVQSDDDGKISQVVRLPLSQCTK